VPLVDVMDSTWLRARPQAVGTLITDPALWRRWWPGLALEVAELREDKGLRWDVTGVEDFPALAGTAELYLQGQGDGVVAHFFLRLDTSDGTTLAPHDVERLRGRYRRLTKRALWTLGDQLDPGRWDRHTSATHASLA
jgi:hypothetical protein